MCISYSRYTWTGLGYLVTGYLATSYLVTGNLVTGNLATGKVVNLQSSEPIFHWLLHLSEQLQSDIHHLIHSAQRCPTSHHYWYDLTWIWSVGGGGWTGAIYCSCNVTKPVNHTASLTVYPGSFLLSTWERARVWRLQFLTYGEEMHDPTCTGGRSCYRSCNDITRHTAPQLLTYTHGLESSQVLVSLTF